MRSFDELTWLSVRLQHVMTSLSVHRFLLQPPRSHLSYMEQFEELSDNKP